MIRTVARNLLAFSFINVFIISSYSFPGEKVYEYKDARVIINQRTIAASNSKIERVWTWTGYGWQTAGLKNKQNNKIYSGINSKYQCDWDLPGAIDDKTAGELISCEVSESDDEGFISRHLQVISTIKYSSAGLLVQHVIWVFPGAPGIRTQLRVKSADGFSPGKLPESEGERIDYGHRLSVPGARCEYLPLSFKEENARRYWGYYNNPGSRHYPHTDMLEETVITGYPLFLPEDVNWASAISIEYENGENGICVVKESPKCVNEQSHYTGSFYSGPDGLSITGWGLTPGEIVPDRFRECWASWTIVWSQGNDGLQLALKQFDRARYPVFHERDLFILSNTWGPADPDGARFTDQDFMMKEIPALAKLGIDVMQIDDGWQKAARGSRAHSFTPKYQNGWRDIKSEADKFDLRFGLWITAQLSTTEELTKNLDDLGFISWKVDYDHLSNRSDYEDRAKKFRDVMKHSWMKTQFTLCPEYDDPRYGWYYFKEYGSIYFQNIQESLPAHLTMVPYQVLRQHWLMSKYFNSNKLQVMLQNPKRTNPERSDAPQHSHSYCFAMGVPFVPCFFQSAQFLDEQGFRELKDLITTYKKHRSDIFSCYTFPIGEKPDNQSWSGFQMINENEKGHNFILLFREIHNAQANRSVGLKFLAKKEIIITNLESGEKFSRKVSSEGNLILNINNPGEYLFLEYVINSK